MDPKLIESFLKILTRQKTMLLTRIPPKNYGVFSPPTQK